MASSTSTTTTPSAAGIWNGTDSVTGLSIIGYIDSTGMAVFVRSDGVQFAGASQVSGATVVAAVAGYTSFGTSFSDGSTYGLGTLNGTVASGSTLTLSLTFTTNSGTQQNGSWSLGFSTLSNSGASLGTLNANYSDATTGAVISINDGVITGQDATNGCVLNGMVTVPSSTTDVYDVTLAFANCIGSYSALNGLQLTGLGAFNGGTSPAQLTIAVSGANAAGKYALVLNLTVN